MEFRKGAFDFQTSQQNHNYNTFLVDQFIKDFGGIIFLNAEENYLYIDGKKTETALGSKVEVILRGSEGVNEFEKLSIKFESIPVSEFEKVKKMTPIKLQGATGTLWGNGAFKNNLSIKAEGFTVLSKDNQ